LWTIPNILTYTRIITTPFIGYFIVSGDTTMALSLFVYSSVTDFVDGFIARRFNMKSVVGSIIDPLADKFLMTVCTLSLAYVNSIPGLVATVIIGRDVMLSFMSFYYRYKSLDPPRTFDKFISISQNPTISVHPSLLGKVNTGLQMLYIGGLVFKPLIETSLALSLDSAFLGMGAVVTATTILSGYTYVFGKNSFKYIK
ncbi:CDP-alcohol phosphatidyltransferase-domain-containing protein, partial [Scheffersomyces xylosifermentans]|uniref:CDP-alcohol phosphatidyltransferase-domain-containing protein n=1 Tax=Scheffersomyces xylosifermentans TaxID=1304137 RepID=UPI00315DBC8B